MKNSTKSAVAKNLQRLLEHAQMSQAEFAERLGVSSPTVSYWLNAKYAPKADMLDQICNVLHVNREDIVSDNDAISPHKADAKSIPLYHSVYANKDFFEESNIARYLALDISSKADFGMVVASDAMSGIGIDQGDIAFFSRNYTFKDGKIYAIWILSRNAIALKRVFSHNNEFMLASEKKNTLPFYVSKDAAYIVGELVGVYKLIEQ